MLFVADLTSSVRAQGRHKVMLAILLTLGFCVPYFALQHVAFMPVRTLPWSGIDRAIPFDPRWVWVYQSGYLLIAMVPWMFDARECLARYVRGFFATAAVGFLCFLLFPVTGPRPDLVPSTGMFAWLAWYDGPTNEFPSLHVGLMTYTLCCGARASRDWLSARSRTALVAVGAAWAIAVSYAALATRQHYFVDLPAGALVGWLAYRWSWR